MHVNRGIFSKNPNSGGNYKKESDSNEYRLTYYLVEEQNLEPC